MDATKWWSSNEPDGQDVLLEQGHAFLTTLTGLVSPMNIGLVLLAIFMAMSVVSEFLNRILKYFLYKLWPAILVLGYQYMGYDGLGTTLDAAKAWVHNVTSP